MHPFILPYTSNLSLLITSYVHCVQTIHVGIKLTLSTIRQEYWIVNGCNLVKKVIRNCTTCISYRGSTLYKKNGQFTSR